MALCSLIHTPKRALLTATIMAFSALAPACGSDASDPALDSNPPAKTPPREAGCEGCTALTGGRIFDGTRFGTGTVVFKGSTIEDVVFGEVSLTAGEIIDISGKTVLPGLFDMHVHTPAYAGPYGYRASEDLTEAHMKAMLRAGVTSFLDLGTSRRVIFELRSRIRDGKILAPSLFAAGPLLTPTGGHPCRSGSPSGDSCTFINAPEDVAPVMTSLLAEGPDVIKIVIESGVGSTSLPEMSAASVAAVSAAALAAGVPVVAHVSEAADVEKALESGVSSFAHLPAEDLVSPDLAAKVAAAGGFVIPTIAVYDSLARIATGSMQELSDPALADDVPAEIIQALSDPALTEAMTTPSYQERALAWRANALANLSTYFKAGVPIAAGTDAGNPGTFHGLAVLREIALYVEAGIPIEDALAAATRVPAERLGRKDLGRLAKGAAADILVVEGDASADISAITRPARVYKSGRLIDRAALALSQETSLTEVLTEGLGEGETCLAAAECGPKLYCAWTSACSPTCSFSVLCDPGSACFPQEGSTTKGFCYEGDGCDPIAQDCSNGEACVWWGNAATSCWWAGLATAGEACGTFGECAPGFQCDYATNKCSQICDPAAPDGGGCPAGQVCLDKSAEAGIHVGECG
jgi:imidazolonepropionase-like amidohydrolase